LMLITAKCFSIDNGIYATQTVLQIINLNGELK
jgi:hypothetical protein